jgi:hypothetical protein
MSAGFFVSRDLCLDMNVAASVRVLSDISNPKRVQNSIRGIKQYLNQ